MRYNLKFRKLTLCGLTRPQSIRKSRQISEQTILSSPQGLEFNPKFASLRGRRKKGRGRGEGEREILRKVATFQWLKIASYGPSRQCYR